MITKTIRTIAKVINAPSFVAPHLNLIKFLCFFNIPGVGDLSLPPLSPLAVAYLLLGSGLALAGLLLTGLLLAGLLWADGSVLHL